MESFEIIEGFVILFIIIPAMFVIRLSKGTRNYAQYKKVGKNSK